MKDKKRVLTVLLILIVIISIILGTVLIFGSIKNSQIEKFQKEVEEVACQYAEDQNITEGICEGFVNLCQVHFDKLVMSEYLSEDLKNPLNAKRIGDDTNSYIQIIWKNNKRVCIYKEG